ncbi:transcriptional regulator [Acidipropionibacterium virtanenii]|uniref:Winged helix DNA-binding domain-containing protein n=1 Tax=Acidipropionibacterium virtanenii TaxID=2057246 RepID=A0A344UX23_9ACTN|nr:transcriptional regulator [Acidipropionibacterium virtanenii]AXE39821.1 hypothetical protein JS278_02685 [Acidipropionibacterium virtanenii]
MDDADINPIIHQLMNFRVCGLLRRVDQAQFSALRDTLQVSDATLSKHIKSLIRVGYVSASKVANKERADSRRIMWLTLTPAGRKAFDSHIRALRQIADQWS